MGEWKKGRPGEDRLGLSLKKGHYRILSSYYSVRVLFTYGM
jgi:hypothetical protein